MLEYENQMFLDVLHQDGLIITAKGLGLETVFISLLKVYSDPGNLVIVLGTITKEEEYFISELKADGVTPIPKIVTTEFQAAERERLYLEGGVLFVSPQILVVDLLKERIPIANVTGFLVFRAHNILETCHEAFAVRLYRQKNKTGFIKAFSNSAQAFTVGFAQVEHIMKTLFLCNLYLWPRFQSTVNTSLTKYKLDVIELHVTMTPAMLQIQAAVLDLISISIKELKNGNSSLDLDELTTENAIAKSFHKILQNQLDPVWNQLSGKTKQLVADLKTLRYILISLTRCDSVTFYSIINTMRRTEYALKSSGWLLLDSAETLFLVAKQRAQAVVKSKDENSSEKDTVVDPEQVPKWQVLSEILKEIDENIRKGPRSSQSEKILILVNDKQTCEQLKQYLVLGGKTMLLHLYQKIFKCKVPKFTEAAPEVKEENEEDVEMSINTSHEIGGDSEPRDSYMLSQKVKSENDGPESDEGQYVELDEASQPSNESEYYPPVIMIQPFKKNGDPLSLVKTLKEHKPKFVVMYDADMTAIRRLEVFHATFPEVNVVVYFVLYGSSVEEQAYLTTLRREKEAFEYLIRTKSTMVIAENQSGLSDDNPHLARDSSKANETVNTRKGGILMKQEEKKSKPTVIVDMREFRSDLPSLIHKRGIEIDPVTLHVGDYILSPDICVERKSINDLIGSLNSGRLYNQALTMTRHYKKPMLLIEYELNKPFAMQGQYYLSDSMSSNDVCARLQLLTLHFPKLRIVWSQNAYATAQLFEELKQGQPEPNSETAVAIGAELEQEIDLDRFNPAIHDFIAKLPGVNSKNIRKLLIYGRSLDHLLSLSKDELLKLVNNSGEAESLYNALHKSYQPSEDSKSTKRGGKSFRGRGRGMSFKKNRT
ncbi:DNA repair endonuclease XPF [Schistocerca nitens]|uniref:DNA repair endonuclease XPF n=1 Tax=Schistocerca nitens TaxID=7011 RepID=UPI0021198917|nr:DNA repair endonuclease XPF [Schistocerca nitens]